MFPALPLSFPDTLSSTHLSHAKRTCMPMRIHGGIGGGGCSPSFPRQPLVTLFPSSVASPVGIHPGSRNPAKQD
ncbi:unnamed protein product [Urochloa humidicola]